MATGRRKTAVKAKPQRKPAKAASKFGRKRKALLKSKPHQPARAAVKPPDAKIGQVGAQPLSTAKSRPAIQVTGQPARQRVILLPANRSLRATASNTQSFLRSLVGFASATTTTIGGASRPPMRVLDSIHEDGAKLVEMDAGDISNLRATQPGLVVVPEVFFDVAVNVQRVEKVATVAAFTRGISGTIAITVSSTSGQPVEGANVVAFTDFANKVGNSGKTDKNGVVQLTLPSVPTLQRLYVYPENGYWGALQLNVATSNNMQVRLDPINFSTPDSLRYFAHAGAAKDGAGVKVAIIDTGVALHHPDLTVAGGECTVSGESPNDFGPLGGDHGTHCAGIVAAHGAPPTGVCGVAPGAAIYSFRVFPTATPQNPEPRASSFDIAKAIDRAYELGCDILNLSLSGGDPDPTTEAAIQDARNSGAIVIAAAGNDGRQPVGFPASDSLCVAVSALGRQGLFPAGSVDEGEIAPPPGTDPANFIAAFSNVGPEIRLTGPGVGVVSTVPEAAYAVMSGTSMATPAISGIAARLLSQNPQLLNASRDANRAGAIVKLLLASAKDLGFPGTLQGQGLPG
jgi:subtilisin